jgi:4,5-dihydroxyphthalate decarboxylase
MAKLQLTLAAGGYDMVRPLADGTITADGIELNVLTGMGPRERHWRMARYNEFDVCELNVAAYFVGRDQHHPYTALPIFLHRRFRHGFVFVNPEKGIREPKDLIGKRVGGTNFMPAGNVWIRGILEEYYGVPHRQITWVTDRDEDVDFKPPADLKLERVGKGEDLDEMLAEGRLDAVISPAIPEPFLRGDKRVKRLFESNKEVEIAYYKQTGIFPIMHVTAIKQEIVDKYPWVAPNLAIAFEKAKKWAYRRIENPRMVPLAVVRSTVEEQQALMGKDPWEFGLTPRNRKALETAQRYTHQQGMTSRLRPLEELFVDTEQGGIRDSHSSGV